MILKVLKAMRLCVLLALSVAAALSAWAVYATPSTPRILFAWGYGADPHLLEALSQHPRIRSEPLDSDRGALGSLLSRFLNIDLDSVNANWSGKWLYVEGHCGVCGKPYAPRGSLIVAWLPGGLAYATREPSPKYDHMTMPRYIVSASPLWRAIGCAAPFPFAAYPTVAFIRGPVRRYRRRRRGLCLKCGYNLTGNVTGVCSECGTEVAQP